MGNANVPFLPPMSPYVLPAGPLNSLLAQYGVNILWAKSHQCPCTYGGDLPGSPTIGCQACHGRGIYYDAEVPFVGLITYAGTSRSPNEPGVDTDTTNGLMINASPQLTIPSTAGLVYEQASLYDAFIEIDYTARYNCSLTVGGNGALPFQIGASVAPTGAVRVYNTVTNNVEIASDYTVDTSNGVSVILNGYPDNTAYMVEYTASPAYTAFGSGGMPHGRPFGLGTVALSKRFTLKLLDAWTRATQVGTNSASPQA